MSHHITYNIIFFEYLIDRDHINLNLNYHINSAIIMRGGLVIKKLIDDNCSS